MGFSSLPSTSRSRHRVKVILKPPEGVRLSGNTRGKTTSKRKQKQVERAPEILVETVIQAEPRPSPPSSPRVHPIDIDSEPEIPVRVGLETTDPPQVDTSGTVSP